MGEIKLNLIKAEKFLILVFLIYKKLNDALLIKSNKSKNDRGLKIIFRQTWRYYYFVNHGKRFHYLDNFDKSISKKLILTKEKKKNINLTEYLYKTKFWAFSNFMLF